MPRIENKDALPDDFLKSLGFPTIAVHQTFHI